MMLPSTVQQEFRPAWLRSTSSYTTSFAGRILAAIAGSGLLSLCAHIAVPHVFTPVPTTMQTFGVVVLGMVLGPWTALCSVLFYLAEGAAGLPVFAPSVTGSTGIGILQGPTGGYLLSYPVAAVAAGFFFRGLRQRTGRFVAAVVSSVIAELPIFVFGALWLGLYARISLAPLSRLAVLPFLPGEVVKIALAAALMSALGTRSRRPQSRSES